MGCASSVNVRIEEDNGSKKVFANGKEVGNFDKIEERSEENQDEDYLDVPSIKDSKNENTQSKSFTGIKKIQNINNINVNDKFYKNQSTNFKYLKENKPNSMTKSNQIINDNINNDNNYNKYIQLRHPLDSSLDNNSDLNQIKNLNISKERQNNNIEVMNSMEKRINNYNGSSNHNNEDDDDCGVNMGNFGDGDNDDMCNLGQSMDLEKSKNKKNKKENDNKEICVIFEMQSTGVKYNINTDQNIKLNDLIELFKKKIKIPPFEKPEFVFNTVFLVDFDKPLSEYKIGDNSKINVFI